ncbi:hypothetical protein CFC21_012514, partial [Triticum aestivum]
WASRSPPSCHPRARPRPPRGPRSSAAAAACSEILRARRPCGPPAWRGAARARCALSASIDGVGGGDMEFLRRIEELAASAGVRTAGCGWPPSLERSASGVGLPLSLRMLKRKKQQRRQQVPQPSRWDERFRLGSAGESVGRAFSSMVLIVRELQSFALQQMLCDDLQTVLARAHGEMQDSFVWLFQHIFAGTPALMLSLMLLLANFTVHSMSNSVAAAAVAPTPPAATVVDTQHTEPSNPRFDAASVKTFSSGRTASVGGGSGGGGDVRPVAGASGDDRRDESRYSLSRVAPQQLTPLAGTGAENIVPDAGSRGRTGHLGKDGRGGLEHAGQCARRRVDGPGRAGEPGRAGGGGDRDGGRRRVRADGAEVRAGRVRGAQQLAHPRQLRPIPLHHAEGPQAGGALLRAGGAGGAGGRGGAEPVRDVPVEGAGRRRGGGGDVPAGHRGRPRQRALRRRVRAFPLEHRRRGHVLPPRL